MKLKFASTTFKFFLISVVLSGCTKKSSESPYQLRKNISSESISVKLISETQDVSVARKLIDERLDLVRGVLTPQVDPYIGKKMLPKNCRPENLPKMIEAEDTIQIAKALSLYSSHNRIFGSCSTEKLLKTQYLVLYCKKAGKLFGFTLYYEDQLPWIQEPIARCD